MHGRRITYPYLVPCETCEAGRCCDSRVAFTRALAFSLLRPDRAVCADYEPISYRGIEGVLP